MISSPSDPEADDPLFLLRQAQEGHPDSLHELLSPYRNMIYRLAYRMTGRPEDAEDLAQEAFVRIIRRLPAFRGECAFGTWVYRVTLNVCLSDRDRRPPPMSDLDALPVRSTAMGPEAAALERTFQNRVQEEIRHLHPSYREVVLLRLIEELPYPEIAEVLGVSTKTAQLRFHRGLKRLRERLQVWMREEER